MPLTPLIYQPNYCESCSASTLCRGNHRLTPERTDLLKSCPPPLSSPRPAPLSVSLHSSLTDLIKIYPVGSLAFITTTGLMKQRIRQNQSCSVPINVHYIATNTQSSLHPLAPETRWACWECLRLTQHPDAPKRGAQKFSPYIYWHWLWVFIVWCCLCSIQHFTCLAYLLKSEWF